MKFVIEREKIRLDSWNSGGFWFEGLANFLIDGEIVCSDEFAKKFLLFCMEDSFEYRQRN